MNNFFKIIFLFSLCALWGCEDQKIHLQLVRTFYEAEKNRTFVNINMIIEKEEFISGLRKGRRGHFKTTVNRLNCTFSFENNIKSNFKKFEKKICTFEGQGLKCAEQFYKIEEESFSSLTPDYCNLI
ncbi:MAG: hypothetical protein KBD63_00720 [Bacteriovoracaceae bacterium]|nr:hypothetical protein [Bacteriovoracaceae bacterium]